MEFLCKKTFELTSEELTQIASLFNRVFGNDPTPEGLKKGYEATPLGYSYHSIMTDGGNIVGFSAYVPAYYICNGKKYVFAYSGGYMTDKAYRDFFNFHDMVINARKFMKAEGVALNFGYPNDKAFPVMIKGKLSKFVGKMHTYCLPYRVGGVKRNLTWLNWATKAFCRLWVEGCSLIASSRDYEFAIHKDEDSFNQTRYNQSEGDYGYAQLKKGYAYYKIKEYEGVRTAFIIDVSPKSPRNFVDSIKCLLKNHSNDFDLILYPGELPFKVTGMFCLPRKLEPKNFNMTATILDKQILDEKLVYDIKNWDTNLSNYDLI